MIALDEIKETIDSVIAKFGSSRVGVIMGTSTSGMFEEERAFCQQKHLNTIPDDYHYSQTEISSPSLFCSHYLGIKGPSYTISTACSSSGKALCSAQRLIQAGICDAVIVGGVDTLCDMTMNGFDSLELISKSRCNPFSANRDGITIGEGAAVFLMTKEGASGDIEFCGWGESSDAHHMCCPEPEGNGAEIAIREALTSANLKPEDIGYINLHGTGTGLNDSMESISIHRIFGSELPCSSTKGLTGHALGAAGALEAAFLWLALSCEENGKIPVPPHKWDGIYDSTLPKIRLSVSGESLSPINGNYSLMSNSFAFGGNNVSVILKKKSLMDLPITEFLPHNDPMILIERVVAFQDDFIHCQTTIHPHSPFCENGIVESYIGIEYMAQTVAAWNGIMAKRQCKKPKIGFLLGSRRLELLHTSFKVGDVLNIYAKTLYMDAEMGSFDCWIDVNGTRAAQARLSVYQPKEQEI
jgi:3-oxoacyl-[acyl-carrier-protein] synthase-1